MNNGNLQDKEQLGDNNTNTNNNKFNAKLKEKPSSLRCIYTNATSLVNKWDAFNSLIQANDFPHVVLVTETWFNLRSVKHLDGYSLFNKDREAVIGGGVATYVRNDVDAFEVCDFGLVDRNVEQIWCKLCIGSESILVGCIYRPPYASHETNKEINDVINRAKSYIDKKSIRVCSLLATSTIRK